ncbi:MAG: hypothetical protein O7A09_03060, partial [Proteobacteria bacterium]|nr:hypothetical protein [Pseudomonadota bacterium]
DLGVALTTLAALALDPGSVRGAAPESEAMDRALGRWTRRKVRRALDGFALDEVVSIDFGLWRQELRALAAATALDQLGGDLRGALLALTEDPEERAGRDLSDAADLRALVSGSPLAKSLVRRCVSAWCTQLAAH